MGNQNQSTHSTRSVVVSPTRAKTERRFLRLLVVGKTIALLMVATGCGDYEHAVQGPNGTITYNVIVIDGCQYIAVTSVDVTHKGNCTNDVHRGGVK